MLFLKAVSFAVACASPTATILVVSKFIDDIFSSFIRTSEYFVGDTDIFYQICSHFFSFRPSAEKLKMLFNYITEKSDSSLCKILLSTLHKLSISKLFVKNDGLKWLNQSLESNLIDINLFADILSKTTSPSRRFKFNPPPSSAEQP